MKFLRPRFTNGSTRHLFHSSGVVAGADAETLGATSAESFEQRQQLEHNRQLVAGYRSAGVMHNYQQEAQGQRAQQQADDEHRKYKKPARYAAGQRSPRLQGASPNRIDIVKPSRQPGNVGGASGPTTGPIVPNRPSFKEPANRRYNPYK